MKEYTRANVNKLHDNVPRSLRAVPQWVCWKTHEREGNKPEKVPINPKTGRNADAMKSATWGSYAEAIERFIRDKELCGIGFVFSHADNFTGIDIDDCRDPKTGALGDWAEAIIKAMDSYTEVSPSGTGVKIFIEGKSPGDAQRRNLIEIYSHSRYFTLTGDAINATEVNPRQGPLADLYQTVFGPAMKKDKEQSAPRVHDPKLARVQAIKDDELLEKARGAANGAKFLVLWNAENIADHSQSDASLCSILAYWTRCDEERIDKLFRQSKLMREKWDKLRGPLTYGQRTIAFAAKGITAMYDPDLDAQVFEGHNDISNAEIFTQLHGDEFIWNLEGKNWLAWNHHHWDPYADLKVLYAAEDVAKELLRRSLENPLVDVPAQQKRIKWAIVTGDKKKVEAIESFARRRIYASSAEFDSDPYILCCDNGIVDLRTGDLRDGTRGDRCLRHTGINYDPKAKCPIWDGFLNDIMKGDKEMIAYLWRVIGYSLTGDVTERAFFLFHGEGRNGKSTFVEILKAILGPPGNGYAQKARFSTFLRKTFSSGSNDDVAHLAGARVVIASETDERNALDTALVKELTGGDTHRARHLYGREFEFSPQFKLFLVTNKVPPIHETTYAIWDRLHYVPFEWRVPDSKVDRLLTVKLLGELHGILAHAVRSCIEWTIDGLQAPDKVMKAGKKLYEEMDTFGGFIDERCEVGNSFQSSHRDLYFAFTYWAREQGFSKPAASKTFAAYLREKHYVEGNGTGNVKFWNGIKLKKEFVGSDRLDSD